jgi:VanZ family protein
LLAPISTPSGAPTNLDKLAHALLMGILAVLLWLAIPIPRWQRGLVSAFGTIAYAGGMELVQGLTAFRTAELADLLAGGLGAVLAVAILAVGTPRGQAE